MAIPWYEWKNIRNRLVVFGRAVQGISPYRVTIQPDKKRCPAGYCNYTRREIAVNPGIFAALPKEQYQLTKALLVHEAGHRRFTTPNKLSSVVHTVANILEDERVERLMADEFAGLRALLRKLSQRLYDESRPVSETSNCPGEVVSYFLQLRWAKRIGKRAKGSLSCKNQELWHKVEPLVYEAWEAETSEIADRNAEEVVHILGLSENMIPRWIIKILEKLGSLEGDRSDEDPAESGSSTGRNNGDDDGRDGTEPFDGEVPPNDREIGSGLHTIEPQPYIELEEKVKPLVQELIEELAFEDAPRRWEAVDKGGKLSLHDYLRDRKHPFLSLDDDCKNPPSLALKVIVDHSTSLNHVSKGVTRMESIAESVMMLHLVCTELGIPHEVIVTPQQLKIVDLDSGERGKALIAGLVPAKTGYEDMGKAIEKHAVPMVNYPEDIKLVLCLTDGACNDACLGKETCKSLRGKVEVIGVLLDPDNDTREYVADMFGPDRVIACRSQELPQKLGNILRAIRGV
jgi:hypothetical protein